MSTNIILIFMDIQTNKHFFNGFAKAKRGEIFKYFGLYGRMFIKCTTLSHIAHNGQVYEK